MNIFIALITVSLILSGCNNLQTNHSENSSDFIIIKGKIEVQSRYFSDSISTSLSLLNINVVDATFEAPAMAFTIRIKNQDSSVYIQKVLTGSSFQTEIPSGFYSIIVSIGHSQEHLSNFEVHSREIVNIYAEIGGRGIY